MKVEMIELPESMAIHVEKLSELLAKAHMVSVAIGTLNAHGEALKGLKESRAEFEDEWIRATDDGIAHADEQILLTGTSGPSPSISGKRKARLVIYWRSITPISTRRADDRYRRLSELRIDARQPVAQAASRFAGVGAPDDRPGRLADHQRDRSRCAGGPIGRRIDRLSTKRLRRFAPLLKTAMMTKRSGSPERQPNKTSIPTRGRKSAPKLPPAKLAPTRIGALSPASPFVPTP
ncbi:hypothetical protein LMG29660_04976 [Burkholderia puraquae]|uniref:Uncharacterized protein n=1 Tax=Burkholderia puraquae TaxID=1904757 RepID=A0A6J5EHB6_9BURK|nr:hypothetical protein LMG29660_04976 [Burkholderia puraquae]